MRELTIVTAILGALVTGPQERQQGNTGPQGDVIGNEEIMDISEPPTPESITDRLRTNKKGG